MPQLGEISKGRVLGYARGWDDFIWQACEGCGKERWVKLIHGEPASLKCRRCVGLGPNNGHWKGGQRYDDGYVFIRKPEHPRAKSNCYVKRATLVLEQKLGRPLLPGMMAHHENGIRDDDRPENLSELSRGKHTALHNKERVSAY